MLQKFGVVKDYWLETKSARPDARRFAATRKEEDRYVFRVPPLRNVAKTAPYFHDGSVAELDRAVPARFRPATRRRSRASVRASRECRRDARQAGAGTAGCARRAG